MQKMTILFGFDNLQFSNFIVAVTQCLQKNGIEVNPVCKISKQAIKEYIQNNPSCYTVVLTEILKRGKYTAEELAELTDDRDMNIIVVLGSIHRGTDYMSTLYAAGITSALFQDGKKGFSANETCKYIYRKRGRREAREYYGIANKKLELGFLSNGTFIEHYNALSDEQYGDSLIERFLMVCQRMTARQIKDFVRRLDDDTKNELIQYEEFFTVVDMLKKFGADLGIKKPRRKLKVGLANATKLIGLKANLQNKPVAADPIIPEPAMVQGTTITTVKMDFTRSETDELDAAEDSTGEKQVKSSNDKEREEAVASETPVEEPKIIDLSALLLGRGVDDVEEVEVVEDIEDLGQGDAGMTAKEMKAELKRIKKEEKAQKKREKLEAKAANMAGKIAQNEQNTSKKEEKKKKSEKNSKSQKGTDKMLIFMSIFAVIILLFLIFSVLVLCGVVPMV